MTMSDHLRWYVHTQAALGNDTHADEGRLYKNVGEWIDAMKVLVDEVFEPPVHVAEPKETTMRSDDPVIAAVAAKLEAMDAVDPLIDRSRRDYYLRAAAIILTINKARNNDG